LEFKPVKQPYTERSSGWRSGAELLRRAGTGRVAHADCASWAPLRCSCHALPRCQLVPPHPVATPSRLSPPPNLSTRAGTPLRHHPCPPCGRHAPSHCSAASSSSRRCLGVGSKPKQLIEVWCPCRFSFPRLAHRHQDAAGHHCCGALRAPHRGPLRHHLSSEHTTALPRPHRSLPAPQHTASFFHLAGTGAQAA
jgi:hypothetical protein